MEMKQANRFPDDILDDALASFPDVHLPDSFTNELVSRIESGMKWKMLLTEFGLKIGLVTAVLAVIAGGLLFPMRSSESEFISFLIRHREIALGVIFVAFFTFLIDQVLLPYLVHRSRLGTTGK